MASLSARAILAANLRKRIDADSPKGERPSVRAWAMGKGLDVRMIDRLVKQQHVVTLDSLENIARALGLEAWHLLLEDLEPGATPDAPVSEEDRAMLRKLRRMLDGA